jgi:ElaB/YqjD/DUF883 family membrane-anchored ribosome-binding protein
MVQASQQSSPSTASGSAAGTGQAKAADAAGQAQEKAQQVAGEAQEKAQQAAGKAQDRVREQIDQRSSQAADQIKEQGSDLRSVGESLREQGKDGPAKAADRLAEYAEKVGGYLSDKDSHALLADAEDFGRKQPWAVAAGGIALGFAASRFLKASSSERYQSHPSRWQGAPAPVRSPVSQDGPDPFTGPGSITPGAAPGVL